MRKCPPRLSVRLRAAAATRVADVVMLRYERVTSFAVSSKLLNAAQRFAQSFVVPFNADIVGHDLAQLFHRVEIAQLLLNLLPFGFVPFDAEIWR